MGLEGVGQWEVKLLITETIGGSEDTRIGVIRNALQTYALPKDIVRVLDIHRTNSNGSEVRGMDQSMVRFSGPALTELMGELRRMVARDPYHSLTVAYDPLDDAIKFKPNDGAWSPPFTAEVK
jgi:hypothetical protein